MTGRRSRAAFSMLGLALGWLTTCAAGAQTLLVQSGEHADFTRLVIAIGEDRDWTLEEDRRGWRLTLDPVPDGFALDGVFDLIPRTRLADLSVDEDLLLDLACACPVTAFRHEERFLVLDIGDAEPALLEAAPERGLPDAALPDLADILIGQDAVDPILSPLVDTPVDPADAPIDAPNPRIAEAAALMAEQLARAAASGLLDAALGRPLADADPLPPVAPVAEAQVEEARSDVEPEAATDPSEAAMPQSLPVTAATALDRPQPAELRVPPLLSEPGCSGALVPLRSWASGAGIDQGLGALNAALYDDRDQLVPDGVMNLARHYLYYGFGAEAAFWLRQLDSPDALLLQIASLVDGGAAPPFADVRDTARCSPEELLWYYLGGAIGVPLLPEDLSALQRAFGDLPPGLRDQLGPVLVRRLHADGALATARTLRDTLHRGGRLDATVLRLIDLDIGLAPDPSPTRTREALAIDLRDDGPSPAATMAAALAFDREGGVPTDPDRLSVAEALLRETGDGVATDTLWGEIVLARAAIGDLDGALALLQAGGRAAAIQDQTLTRLFDARVDVDDVAAVLVLAHLFGDAWRPDGSEGGRVRVRAIAALHDSDLLEAATILQSTQRALVLPTEPAMPETEADRIARAWAEGDWPTLAALPDGAHRDLARRMLDRQGPENEPTPQPELTAIADRVEDSVALRATVLALLAAPAAPRPSP